MNLIPTVIEKSQFGERAYDIYSRLLNERIVFIGGHIDSDTANTVVAQLLFLDYMDAKRDIQIYLNTPGGSVSAGLAIYDAMQYVKADVSTICIGMAASMGALLLAGGKKGKRFALPNADIMIHQVLAGPIEGQASDIEITAKYVLRLKERTNGLLAKHTGKSVPQITKDGDRDNFMSAEEAKAYGLIDAIIKSHA